jgi:hypothetical protein
VPTPATPARAPQVRAKLTQLLQFAARGVQQNPTAGGDALLLYVHHALSEGLAAEEAARERAKQAAGPAALVPGSRAPGTQRVSAAEIADGQAQREERQAQAAGLHQHLLIEFSLSLLNAGIKKGPLAGRSPEVRGAAWIGWARRQRRLGPAWSCTGAPDGCAGQRWTRHRGWLLLWGRVERQRPAC